MLETSFFPQGEEKSTGNFTASEKLKHNDFSSCAIGWLWSSTADELSLSEGLLDKQTLLICCSQ